MIFLMILILILVIVSIVIYLIYAKNNTIEEQQINVNAGDGNACNTCKHLKKCNHIHYQEFCSDRNNPLILLFIISSCWIS